MSDKLEKLLAKQEQLKAQIKQAKSKETKQQRKTETRKKILVGAMMLEWVKQGRFSEANLLAGLDGFLSRDSDRMVFGLPLKVAVNDTEQTPPNSPEKPVTPSATNEAITRHIGSPITPSTPRRLVERREQAELEKEFL